MKKELTKIVTEYKPEAKRISCVTMNIIVGKTELVYWKPRHLPFYIEKLSKNNYSTRKEKIL